MRVRAVATVAAVGLLAACGGELDALGIDAGNDLVAAQDPSAQGAQLSGYLHAAARVLRTHVNAIGQLVPPANLQGDVSRFVSALNSYADQLDALADRTRPGDTYEQLLTHSAPQVSSLNGLSDQANKIAAKLNFKDCAT